MTEQEDLARQAATALAQAIEADDVDGPLTDDRTHVAVSQGLTACGRIVGSVRCVDVGETVNCPECIVWLDEEEAVTPPRGTSLPSTVEMGFEVDPVVQLWLQITLPDGKGYRVTIPQTILEMVRTTLSAEDQAPHRGSWKWPGHIVEIQPEPSKG